MDDLEKAVLFSFDQSGAVGPELRAQAEQYCAQAKAQPPQSLWRACAERVTVTQHPEVQFWCLQVLEELVRLCPLSADVSRVPRQGADAGSEPRGYSALSEGDRAAFCSALLSLAFLPDMGAGTPTPMVSAPAWSWPPFVRNKLCQVIALLIQREYPHFWGTSLPQVIQGFSQGVPGADMGCRILSALDEVVISLEYVRSTEESAAAARVKDGIRVQCVVQMVQAWFNTVLQFATHADVAPFLDMAPHETGGAEQGASSSDREISAAGVLQVMQPYISWIDIQLVASEAWTGLLSALLALPGQQGAGGMVSIGTPSWPRVRAAAAGCLLAMVTKRMEVEPKVALLARINLCQTVINPGVLVLAAPDAVHVLGGTPAPATNGTGVGDDDVSTASSKVAELITGLAHELLESVKKLEASQSPGQAAQALTSAQEMLGTVLSAVFLLAQHAGEEEVASSAFQFLLEYAAWMKKYAPQAPPPPNKWEAATKGGKKKGGAHKKAGQSENPAQRAATQEGSEQIPPQQQEHVGRMLWVIYARMKYPVESTEDLDIPTKTGQEEEEERQEFRKDLFVLLRSLSRIDPATTCSFIHSTLSSTLSNPSSSFPEVEASLQLFYELGEGLSEAQHTALLSTNPLPPGSGNGFHVASSDRGSSSSISRAGELISSTLSLILSSAGTGEGCSSGTVSFPHRGHRLVCLSLMEIGVRYVRFVQHWVTLIPGTVALFLGDWGVNHPHASVGGRAAYLLMRVVKVLRQQLVPVLDQILQGMERPLVGMSTSISSQPPHLSGSVPRGEVANDDRLYAFEAVGLLLGQPGVPEEHQIKFLSAVLLPLIHQVESVRVSGEAAVSGTREGVLQWRVSWSLQHCILAYTYLSKGFPHKLACEERPAIGQLFLQAVQGVLRAVQTLPPDRGLSSKSISLVHRMKDVLGDGVLPAVLPLLHALLPHSQAKDLSEMLVLLTQIVSKFGCSAAPLVDEALSPLTSRVFELLPSDLRLLMAAPGTTAGSTAEEVREQRDLHRSFILFVHSLTNPIPPSSPSSSAPQHPSSTSLSHVLCSPRNGPACLPRVTQLLLRTAACSYDLSLRKACVTVFMRLIGAWCTPDSEMVPGFRSFILEKFIPQACLIPCLHPSFNTKDVNSLLALSEVASALVTAYQALGPVPVIEHLQNALLPSLLPSPSLCTDLSLSIQSGDPKIVRDGMMRAFTQIQLDSNLCSHIVNASAALLQDFHREPI